MLFSSFHFILFGGFIGTLSINIAYLIRGASCALQEKTEIENKINSLNEEIRLLKEKPNLELQKEDKLLALPNKWFESMIKFFMKLNSFEDDIVPFILQSLRDTFDCDGAVFFLADAFEDNLVCKSYIGSFPPPYKLPDDVPHKEDIVKLNFQYYECRIGETLFGKVAQNKEPYYLPSYVANDMVYQNGEEDFLKIGSIVAFPLFTNGHVSAVFALSKNSKKEGFSRKDFENISTLSQYFSSIVSLVLLIKDSNEMNILNNTENTAQQFRDLLLPKKLKNKHNLDIDFYFRKQHGVCSDYYDVISHKDRTFAIVLDVAGKSMQAITVMIMMRAILYLITNTNENLSAIVDWLNKGITGKIGIDHFSTLSLLCYYPKQKRLEFIAAGNQSMILYKARDRQVEVFHHRTDPIGIDANSKYKGLSYNVDKGDVVLLYTDGISAMLDKDGKPFEIGLLAKMLVENSGKSAKDITKVAKDLIVSFTSGTSLHDDQTLLAIKIK